MNSAALKSVPRGGVSRTGENRRDTILSASEIVFASSGFKGATVREIAELAGVAQGLIHYHFKSKEVLFEAMVERRSGEINNSRATLLDEIRNGAIKALIADRYLRPINHAMFAHTL